MHAQLETRLPKWPFLLGDALLLGAAGFIFSQRSSPMASWQIGFIVLCVAGGAVLAILPFLLEYRVTARLLQIREFTDVVAQIKNLEAVAGQIRTATERWSAVQEGADKTAASAKAIADRMDSELKGFTEFIQRANETEKATLRLEVEKSRRTENEWLQVLVRMLDHVHALHSGAMRSGSPNLIEQMGHFQNACRDTARRVGLTPFDARQAEPFDTQRHQLADGDGKAFAGTPIAETLATGYTFQGRLLRPAIVKLEQDRRGETPLPGCSAPEQSQPHLPLSPAGAREG
jgi:molecular chaperone GrpE (heat shock protein)